MNNYDVVMSMTPQELAEYLTSIQITVYKKILGISLSDKVVKEIISEELKFLLTEHSIYLGEIS